MNDFITAQDHADRIAREYGVQTEGLAVGHEYHQQVEADRDYTLAEVQAAGGKITRVRMLQEGGLVDISYVHATLPGNRVVRVNLNWMDSSLGLWRKSIKGEFIKWAKNERVFAKGLGLLDEGNWSILR